MTVKKRSRQELKTSRASVSFPTRIYGELEKIAEAKKVSIAWVVREAAERYVANHAFTGEGEREERV